MQFLKIHHLVLLTVIQFMFLANTNAQLKTYKLTENGDTINAIDKKDLKQGKWVISIAELRGEPGYEEEGIFKNNNKEGIWRLYTLTGDLIGVENYLLGSKDGIQQYFTFLGKLEKEENWRAYNPNAPYDTVAIYGTGSNEIVDYKIVKAEPYSVKDGSWKYYDTETGQLIKTEKYDRGRLLKHIETVAATPATTKPKKVEKTSEMIDWEKKNKNKKNALRDGQTKVGN